MKKTENILAVIALLSLLLALYVTSYLLDVEPVQGGLIGHFVEGQRMSFFPAYRYGGSMAETVYYPLQLIDAQIRPEHWTWIYHAPKFGP